MAGGNWQDPDGLFRQYGTSKAVPTTAGDYLSYGEWRDVEFTVNLGSAPYSTAGTYIVGNTTFLGTNIFLESVNVSCEVSAAGGTSMSVGTIRLDRSTNISNTNILPAIATATLVNGYNNTSTTAAGLIGKTITSSDLPDGSAYITVTTIGTFSAGTVKVRLRYRGVGTITQ